MSTLDVDSSPRTGSARDEYLADDEALNSRRTIQLHHRELSQSDVPSNKAVSGMVYKCLPLWHGCSGVAYTDVRLAIVDKWEESSPVDRKFLEDAVDLLQIFQTRTMESTINSWDWSNEVIQTKIDAARYFSWVQDQYQLLARKKRQGFDNITLERFIDCLLKANWMHANDESAVVNFYLLNADLSRKPEINLGTIANYILSLRVNGTCLRIPKADVSTADSYGVTIKNPDILLSIRYVASDGGKESFLFVPIGNVFCMADSGQDRSAAYSWDDDWKITGVVLLLRISEDGKPRGFYMVADHKLLNTMVSEGREPVGSTTELGLGSLEKIMNMDMDMLRWPSNESRLSMKTLELTRFATSKVEIVQTGVIEEWSHNVVPIGLYPIKQDQDGGLL